MQFIRLYNSFEEATFVRRVNRFVLELDLKGKRIYAHLPNTGRLYEFLEPGRPFYVVKVDKGKYPYKAVSAYFDGQFIFIDTIKSNYLFYLLLKAGVIEDLKCKRIKREYRIAGSRFDFFLEWGMEKAFIEVKTCTLCLGGLGMFPDAPTSRGRKHIDELSNLAEKGYKCYVVFLIPNYNAIQFIPNYHVDLEYASSFVKAKGVKFRAFKMKFVDPVTVDLSSVDEVTVQYEAVRKNLVDRGTYILVLKNDKDQELSVGGLGKVNFRRGFYVYVGSAQTSLEKRLKRHFSVSRKKWWHIDYIGNSMRVFRVFVVRGEKRCEKEIAMDLMKICDGYIPGFGTGDSPVQSHLFYFYDQALSFYPPVLNKVFLSVLPFQVRSLPLV